ncbi:MAG TPA: hypothetical protein VGF46_05210 [Gaiellales bacterium]
MEPDLRSYEIAKYPLHLRTAKGGMGSIRAFEPRYLHVGYETRPLSAINRCQADYDASVEASWPLSTFLTVAGHHLPPCAVGTPSAVSDSAIAVSVAPSRRSRTIRSTSSALSVLDCPSRTPRARLIASASFVRCEMIRRSHYAAEPITPTMNSPDGARGIDVDVERDQPPTLALALRLAALGELCHASASDSQPQCSIQREMPWPNVDGHKAHAITQALADHVLMRTRRSGPLRRDASQPRRSSRDEAVQIDRLTHVDPSSEVR